MPNATPTPNLEQVLLEQYFLPRWIPLFGFTLLIVVVVIIVAYLYRRELARLFKRFLDLA